MGTTNLLDLDNCVLSALELFSRTKLPSLPHFSYHRPLVIGSGNALVTGKILFAEQDAIFADESTYRQKIKAVKDIDSGVLISASGGKHAPRIAKELRKRKLPVILLTNNPQAAAGKYATKMYVFPKQPEPYTYNTSTYLGMILAKTKEDPEKILDYLQKIQKIKPPGSWGSYDAFFLIVPAQFELLREMFLTKFDELFGPKVSGRVFTVEQAKHAKTVVPSAKELFISLGGKNTLFGNPRQRWDVPLPSQAGYGLVMALGYYIIGQIQKQHPPYFRQNIGRYCREASKMFGEEIKVMVG